MTYRSLLEFVSQTDLSRSDGSDAGKGDVSKKAGGIQTDVKFSLMRNTINADGKISGSDVANYLEKAKDLNDEVDSVLYGLETDDGKIVKVYVNATQADAFEAEMKKLLGMEDDIEEAINELAGRFDIVDVIWPKGEGPNAAADAEDPNAVNMDDQADVGDPAHDAEPDEDDDEMDVIGTADDDGVDRTNGTADEVSQEPAAGEEGEEGEGEAAPEGGEEETPPEEEEDKGKDKHSKLKNVGKKMKAAEGYNPQGDNMSIGNKFLQRVLSEGHLEEAGKAPAKPAEDRDGVIDGFNIPLDGQQRMLVSKLKFKLEKQVIVLFSLLGIPGLKLNTEGITTGVQEAAEMLRQQLSVRRAFMDFLKVYATATGHAIEKDAPKEVTPDELAMKEGLNEAKLKAGNYLQKQLETILVKLGLPEDLVSTTGPQQVKTALYRASKVIEDNSDLKLKMRMLAVRMGLKPSDAMAPLDDEAAEAKMEARRRSGRALSEAPAMQTQAPVAPRAGQAPAATEVETATHNLLLALGINSETLPPQVARKMKLVQQGDKNAGSTIARMMDTLSKRLSQRGRDLQ
jgi:hypothetical protein